MLKIVPINVTVSELQFLTKLTKAFVDGKLCSAQPLISESRNLYKSIFKEAHKNNRFPNRFFKSFLIH